MFDLPQLASTSTDSSPFEVSTNKNADNFKTSDGIMEEIAEKFWIIFTIYIIVSVLFVMYCIISYRRQWEKCEYEKRENSVARYLEVQMNSILLRIFSILVVMISLALSFDKKELQKDYKMNEYEKDNFYHHSISRRVLRFERSIEDNNEQFTDDLGDEPALSADFFQPILDFARPQPEFPQKTKPSHVDPDVDYRPDLEFK